MRAQRTVSFFGRILHRVFVVLGAGALTLLLFLVLPLIQAIHRPPSTDLMVQAVDTAMMPPPPAPPEEPPPPEPEPEEEPPELTDDAPPLDLSQLELALNPGFGGDWPAGDFAVRLDAAASAGGDADSLFSVADLDQEPRVIYQPGPIISRKVRKMAPGTVYVLFIVDQDGRVQQPVAQNSDDPVFERPAIAAVKQWKFEPGRRNGQAVRFRMRVPITFPKGQ